MTYYSKTSQDPLLSASEYMDNIRDCLEGHSKMDSDRADQIIASIESMDKRIKDLEDCKEVLSLVLNQWGPILRDMMQRIKVLEGK